MKPITYTVTVNGEGGKPLPYFPPWEQSWHPFQRIHQGRHEGTLHDARVLLQRSEAWESGNAKERLMALESVSRLIEQGRPAPPLRLPSTATSVCVRASRPPADGLMVGVWQIQRRVWAPVVLSLPEGWEPTEEMRSWVQEMAHQRGVPEMDWERVTDYALQPWKLSVCWPHPE